MNDQQSLSGVFLGLGGGTVIALGVASTAVGTLFAVNKISGLGISVLQSLPSWFGLQNNQNNQNNQQQYIHNDQHNENYHQDQQQELIQTKQSIGQQVGVYFKIGGLIVVGVGLRYVGYKMSSPEATQTFNNLLSGKLN